MVAKAKTPEEHAQAFMQKLTKLLNTLPADLALWVSPDGQLDVVPAALELSDLEWQLFAAGQLSAQHTLATGRALKANVRGYSDV